MFPREMKQILLVYLHESIPTKLNSFLGPKAHSVLSIRDLNLLNDWSDFKIDVHGFRYLKAFFDSYVEIGVSFFLEFGT